MRFSFLTGFFAFFVVFGCTYSPVEQYYREVKKVDLTSPKYSISLDSYKNGDTIYLYSSPIFKYAVSLANGALKQVDVTFGGIPIYSGSQSSGSFDLKANLKTGIFELKIQYVASSGTGSLADVTGSETVQLWKKWIVKVDIDPPPSPNVKMSIVNGFLKLSWDKYSKPNFSGYLLNYSRGNNGNNSLSTTIKDSNVNFWIDSSYVGGSATCKVFTAGYTYGPESSASFHQILSLNVQYNAADSIAKFLWTKSPGVSALKEYDLYLGDKLVNSVSNPSDTSFSYKINPYYGADIQIELRYVPKYPRVNFNPSERTFQTLSNTVGTKKLARPWAQLYFSKGTNSILSVYKNLYFPPYETRIYRYNTNLDLVDSLFLTHGETSLQVTYSGSSIYYSKGNQGFLYSLNLLAKQETSIPVDISTSAPYPEGPGLLSVSGNDVVCYDYGATISGAGNGSGLVTELHHSILNLASGISPYSDTKTVNITLTYKPDVFIISDDAGSVKINDNFYAISGSSNTLLGTITTGQFIGYRQDNPTEILISTPNGIEIRDATNLSVKRTILKPFGDTGYTFFDYDPATSRVLFYKNYTAYLINIDTNHQRVANMIFNTGYGSKLIGGFFISNGSYFKI